MLVLKFNTFIALIEILLVVSGADPLEILSGNAHITPRKTWNMWPKSCLKDKMDEVTSVQGLMTSLLLPSLVREHVIITCSLCCETNGISVFLVQSGISKCTNACFITPAHSSNYHISHSGRYRPKTSAWKKSSSISESPERDAR